MLFKSWVLPLRQENALFQSACNFLYSRTLKRTLPCAHFNAVDLNQDTVLLFLKVTGFPKLNTTTSWDRLVSHLFVDSKAGFSSKSILSFSSFFLIDG